MSWCPSVLGDRFDKSDDQPEYEHWVAGVRQVTRAAKDNEFAVRQLRQTLAAGQRLTAIIVAVDDQHRAAHSGTQVLGVIASRQGVFALVAGDHLLGFGIERPADGVLELLGRVRFGQLLVEEELDPAAIAAGSPPEFAVAHRPANRRVERDGPSLGRSGPMLVAGSDRDPRLDRDHPSDTVGIVGGELQCPSDCVAMSDDHGPLRLGRIQHRRQVGDDLRGGVTLTRMRTIGSTRPHPVRRDHSEATGQRRHERLPGPGVHDR